MKIEEINTNGVIQSHELQTGDVNGVFIKKDSVSERNFGRDEEIKSTGLVCSFSDTTADTVKSGSFLTSDGKCGQYLPSNWPCIPQLFRRRSCELTQSTLPCINKAIAHLELIQNVIDDWYKERGTGVHKTVSISVSKRHLRFGFSQQTIIEQTKREESISSASQKSLSSLVSNQTRSLSCLEIQGRPIGAKMEKKESQGTFDIPFLGAEDVIEEVVALLARLESDRQETGKSYANEEKRADNLKSRINRIHLKRMEELPLAVQNEHEACILDLNELQWHVAYSTRNEARINSRASIAEVQNERLKTDILYVEKHIPLVEEKLELELEAMQKIRTAQSDTNTELENAKGRQIKTEQKSAEAQTKAEKEKGHIKKELDSVKYALSEIYKELSDTKMTFSAYVQQINDIERQLKENEQEVAVLKVKNENAKAGEEMKAIQVREFESTITETEFEHEHLKAENEQLSEESAVRKKSNDLKIEELVKASRYKDRQLQQLTRKNKEAEMEVKELIVNIRGCKEQQQKDAKNISRIHNEMGKLQQQMAVTLEEFNRVQTINSSTRDKLQMEEDRAFQSEEKLKATAETLRKQVKEEMQTRSVLQARIHSDTSDMTAKKAETQKKNGQAKKVAETVEAEVYVVEKKVNRLRSAKKEKTEKRTNLKQQLVETQTQQEESLKKFENSIKTVIPMHDKLKEECLKEEKKLDEIESKKEKMLKELQEMDGSRSPMDRMIAATEKNVEQLEEQLVELKLQLQTLQKIEDDLKHEMNDVVSRLDKSDQNHQKYLADRAEVLENLEDLKKENLHLNKESASSYRKLQNEYFRLKEDFLRNFEERVKLENKLKDSKRIQHRQTRLIGSLLEYFKYQGLYNKSELKRMESESAENGGKIMDLKQEMDTALQKIAVFMQTEVMKVSGPREAFGPMSNRPVSKVVSM